MKKFFAEFREFIDRGNAMNLAVGVIIGAAFTAIVNSVANDLIMPVISIFTGGIDFSHMRLYIPIGEGTSYFAYGSFLNAVIQFLIITFVVFCLVKTLNRINRGSKEKDEEEEASAPDCPYCLEEIKEGATRCPHCGSSLAS